MVPAGVKVLTRITVLWKPTREQGITIEQSRPIRWERPARQLDTSVRIENLWTDDSDFGLVIQIPKKILYPVIQDFRIGIEPENVLAAGFFQSPIQSRGKSKVAFIDNELHVRKLISNDFCRVILRRIIDNANLVTYTREMRPDRSKAA